jgi:hypothetical protein
VASEGICRERRPRASLLDERTSRESRPTQMSRAEGWPQCQSLRAHFSNQALLMAELEGLLKCEVVIGGVYDHGSCARREVAPASELELGMAV